MGFVGSEQEMSKVVETKCGILLVSGLGLMD